MTVVSLSTFVLFTTNTFGWRISQLAPCSRNESSSGTGDAAGSLVWL